MNKYAPVKKVKKTLYETFRLEAENIASDKIDYRTQQGISHSQYELFYRCPLAWYYQYPKKLVKFKDTIHVVFGTAVHSTIQEYVKTIYLTSAKAADALDLEDMFENYFIEEYSNRVEKNGGLHFSSREEMEKFDDNARAILKAIKKDRSVYFPVKNYELVGIELPLKWALTDEIFFIGFIDIILYDSKNDIYIIYDLKTSTRGWTHYDKSNRIKTGQMVGYREFVSKQYRIPIEKIKCEYIILRREVDTTLEFVPKVIQSYEPPVGPKITKQYHQNIEDFISTRFTSHKYVQTPPEATPSESACKFCAFKDNNELCNVSYK